jgi:hypothetical protein
MSEERNPRVFTVNFEEFNELIDYIENALKDENEPTRMNAFNGSIVFPDGTVFSKNFMTEVLIKASHMANVMSRLINVSETVSQQVNTKIPVLKSIKEKDRK